MAIALETIEVVGPAGQIKINKRDLSRYAAEGYVPSDGRTISEAAGSMTAEQHAALAAQKESLDSAVANATTPEEVAAALAANTVSREEEDPK